MIALICVNDKYPTSLKNEIEAHLFTALGDLESSDLSWIEANTVRDSDVNHR